MTGFAEYLIWQQRDHVDGIILSDLKQKFPASSVSYRTPANFPSRPVHLFFSDVCRLPETPPIHQRYLEKYTKRQFLLSCQRALKTIAEGGHFVCKMLDTLTRFTAGLIYLMYRSFKSITILRPFTLDPSKPERFLVCQGLKYPVNKEILQHLDRLSVVEKIEDIMEVVPLKCLLESQFQQYLADTSQRLIQREIQALDKRLWYCKEDEQVSQFCDD